MLTSLTSYLYVMNSKELTKTNAFGTTSITHLLHIHKYHICGQYTTTTRHYSKLQFCKLTLESWIKTLCIQS